MIFLFSGTILAVTTRELLRLLMDGHVLLLCGALMICYVVNDKA